jgi:hypothetical protein
MQPPIAALLLAHLNPVTNTHVRIISYLKSLYRTVYVFPVRFLEYDREINTKSFPFPYALRKTMIDSVFKGTSRVLVLPDYTFRAPFIKYLPPLMSPYSWFLRNNIVRNVSESKFVSYTGDHIERIALKFYRLNPIKASRLEISASSIKEMMYVQAKEEHVRNLEQKNNINWHKKVPIEVLQLIKENWEIVRGFASSPDQTLKFMGMKFPTEGFL